MRKSKISRRKLFQLSALAGAAWLSPWGRTAAAPRTAASQTRETFAGPFASWTNLKTKYGAKGDGIADDTTAVQAALNDLGNTDASPVLWLPSGTYRVTKTLEWTRNIGDGWMNILGEHPATTRLIWDGALDGIMFRTHNINNSRFGRVTWDGRGRASCAIQHTSSGSSSGNEHVDEWFRDVGMGLRGGTAGTQMVAEMSVRRCHFNDCTRAGISVQNANSLDWWVWDSLFEDCYVGVTSGYGQGNFHVFSSVFRRSTFADTVMGFGINHVLADNYSLGSRAFCLAAFSLNPMPLVIQRNVIVEPTLGANPPPPHGGGLDHLFPYELHGPIAVKYFGPLLLLDNVIKSQPNQGAPVVESGADLLAVGNTFTSPNALLAGKRAIEFDNHVVAADTLKISEPVIPDPAPRFVGQTFEVAPNATSKEIQAQIDAAARLGAGTVVHLPYGTHRLTQSLIIPAQSEIQLVGDGRTILEWMGEANGTALVLQGPSHATLRDFNVQPALNPSSGIRVRAFDQSGARVLMQGVQARGLTNGLKVSALDQAVLELRDSQLSTLARNASLTVAGGTRRGGGEETTGRVNWFSGATGGSVPTFSVSSGGALLTRAFWYEGDTSSVAQLAGSGEFTLLGAMLARAAQKQTPAPSVAIEDFYGKVAILASQFGDQAELSPKAVAVRAKGTDSGLGLLVLGACGGSARKLSLVNDAPKGEVGFLLNRSAPSPGDNVWDQPGNYWGEEPYPYVHYLREMLKPAREQKPRPLADYVSNVTDLRLYRVYVFGFETAIVFEG